MKVDIIKVHSKPTERERDKDKNLCGEGKCEKRRQQKQIIIHANKNSNESSRKKQETYDQKYENERLKRWTKKCTHRDQSGNME